MNKTLLSTTALMGTIMGAGFLGLPYVVSKAGITLALAELIVIGAIMVFVMLGLGEVILRTKEKHQLAGYAGKYLGAWGKRLMVASMIIGIYAALLAYIIAESQSLSFVFSGTIRESVTWGILFWACASLITYGGLKSVKKVELGGVVLVIGAIAFLAIRAYSEIKVENLLYLDPTNWATPLGVIVFSLLGYSALPEVREIQGKKAPTLKKAIVGAYLVVMLVYIVFSVLVVGALGQKTPEIATLALGRNFALIGVITMLTAYLALSTAIIDMLKYDYKWTHKQAWMLSSSIPLALFALITLIGKASFTLVLGIGGLISGGLTLVMILLMIQQARTKGNRKPEYTITQIPGLSIILTTLFLAMTLLELYALVR